MFNSISWCFPENRYPSHLHSNICYCLPHACRCWPPCATVCRRSAAVVILPRYQESVLLLFFRVYVQTTFSPTRQPKTSKWLVFQNSNLKLIENVFFSLIFVKLVVHSVLGRYICTHEPGLMSRSSRSSIYLATYLHVCPCQLRKIWWVSFAREE